MIQLLYASLGSLGFGMIFKANKNKMIWILIGGFLNFLVYSLVFEQTSNVFLSSMMCAVMTSVYSLIMAITLKCPSTIFILTGFIPVVPGSNLFYMMQGLVSGDYVLAKTNLQITIFVILGIVSGMALVTVITTLVQELLKVIHKKRA